MQERRAAGRHRALECRREFVGALDRLAVRAEGARERGEIGIDERRAVHARRIGALLVHPDRPVHARCRRRRRSTPSPYWTAVATSCPFIRKQPSPFHESTSRSAMHGLGRDRRRHAIAHRADVRCELRAKAAVAVQPVQPRRVVAGAVGHDRVVGQPRVEPLHDAARGRARPGPAAASATRHSPRALRLRGPRRPPRGARVSAVSAARNVAGRRRDRERGLVDAAQLLGTGMDVDQRLRGHGRREQRIARRRHLAQPLADHEQHVGVANARGELRIDADPDVAGVERVPVVEQVLVAESAGDRQRERLGHLAQRAARGRVPAAAADEHERPLRCGEQLRARRRRAPDPARRPRARRARHPRRSRARPACPRAAQARQDPAGPTWRVR